ncbi:hypothetical protein BDR06DRAFT_956492 [Suillus hirtellus]|nr:hypothetical protein BDR06DRAFT_956492 [Suillus hirtellus]
MPANRAGTLYGPRGCPPISNPQKLANTISRGLDKGRLFILGRPFGLRLPVCPSIDL